MTSTLEIGDYCISQEHYSSYIDILKELNQAHWDEVGMPGADGLKLDIDHGMYLMLELYGSHLGFLIKKNNLPIGYLSVMIYDHHQHRGVKFAQNDGLFIAKKYRRFSTFKVLKKLFKFVEEKLKEKGVSYFTLTSNAQGTDLKLLTDSLGMKHSSTSYTKRL